MKNNQLSPELVSLVHHVELNKSGWWEKSIQQLILSALCTIEKALNVEEILDLLKNNFSTEIDKRKLEKQIERLQKSLDLISPKDGYFILPETVKIKYQNQLKEGEKLEEKVRSYFAEVSESKLKKIDGDKLWEEFLSRYFYPLVKETGANTYNLINGNSLSDDLVRFENFLKIYSENDRENIREIVDEFLNSTRQEVRDFILRSLNAYFFVEAAGLREDSLIALTKATKKSIVFTVFVDTNLLIAILGLKESIDEAGKIILELVEKLLGKVQIKLCVLPITLDETRNLLGNKKSKLRNLRLSSNLADAALNMGLDEIDAKFIHAYKTTGISADDYFEDYVSDLQTVIKEKNIVFVNESTDKYSMRNDVIDDINIQLDYEKEKFKEEAKSYEKLKHDVILWHFVNDRRSAQIESPLEADKWILTFDSRLRAYDNYKKNAAGKKIPICLHPLTFIQMLQFWIPRTPEFDEAILSSLRLPFLSQEFDARSQQVTLDIIRALGKYQDVGSFKKETVSEILMNKALRQKISLQKDENQQFELVENVLIQKYQESESELAKERKRNQLLANEALEKDSTRLKLSEELNLTKLEVEKIQKELATERNEKEEIRKQQLISDEQRAISDEQTKFRKKWIVNPFLIISIIGIISGIITAKYTDKNYFLVALLIFIPLLFALVWIANWQGEKKENIRNWSFFQTFHNFKKVIFWILGITWGLIGGALGTPIWDWMKSYFGNS